MAKDAIMVHQWMLKSIEKTNEILPLLISGVITEEEALTTLKEKFTYDKNYDVVLGFMSRKILSAKSPWVREITLEWIRKSDKGLFFAIRNEIFTRDELKPFVFMYLIRAFEENRALGSKDYVTAGAKLLDFKHNGLLSDSDEDTLLASLHLMKSDLGCYNYTTPAFA